MKDYGKVRSAERPEEKVIDEFSVWIASDIKTFSEPGIDDQEVREGFEYNLVQYDKDEYIKIMDDKNADLEQQITDAQLALCDVYEMLL
jgi:hypothetical protein